MSLATTLSKESLQTLLQHANFLDGIKFVLSAFVIYSCCMIAVDWVVYEWKRKAHGCGKIPRYPHRDPFFGFDIVLGMAKALRNDYFLVWLNKIHENLPKTFLVNFVGTRFIYTIEPENMKSMSAINWQDFAVGPMRRNNKATAPFADKGVNTVDGHEWEFSRFLIKPFFKRETFTDTARLTIHVDRVLELLPADGETVNIQPLIQRWFLDVTTESLFGESIESLVYPERAPICWAMVDFLRGPTAASMAWLDAVDVVHKYLNAHIGRTYNELNEYKRQGKDPETADRKDLLWYMASNLQDKEALRSQLCLIFVPNNDTTSIFISHILWNLARHPEIYEKCRQEVLAVGDAELTFSVLRNMKYLIAILNETHRLFPNGVTQARKCIRDTTLPVGGNVIHRDRDIWGPDAEGFRPERWENLRPYWNFVPFGGGPRRCPAQMLVTAEASYFRARLMRVYKRIEARDPNPYVGVMRVGPSNKTGVQIALFKE
ncbi:putative cytochrome P450 monooxygenase [Aspergillus novofumigatus IBT 16806]|uniref:Putative cytochrome P450 monooxygenase n=1 Tax=Aspergillus novofumigatus (strain IBT 16806) TaxID=1392255 RepID=A0A2I1BV62_ASPN1|nr:putative cytochrome P450 monooxygenase [Aspergillus novofumigatus IBT 16806]PKX89259.1 putative cytochrome P450 monooxygenase [Aspergillus novofumigatus IBT 16806]